MESDHNLNLDLLITCLYPQKMGLVEKETTSDPPTLHTMEGA